MNSKGAKGRVDKDKVFPKCQVLQDHAGASRARQATKPSIRLAGLALQQRENRHGMAVAKGEIGLKPVGDLGGFDIGGNSIGATKPFSAAIALKSDGLLPVLAWILSR